LELTFIAIWPAPQNSIASAGNEHSLTIFLPDITKLTFQLPLLGDGWLEVFFDSFGFFRMFAQPLA